MWAGTPGADGSFHGKHRIASTDEFTHKVRRMSEKTLNTNLLIDQDSFGGRSAASQVLVRIDDGMQAVPFINIDALYKSKSLQELVRKNPVVEFAYVGPVVDIDKQTVPGETERKQVGKSLFGKPRYTDAPTEKTVFVNPHNVPLNELVAGIPNTNEPAVLFAYQFCSDPVTHMGTIDRKPERGFGYTDPNGRAGNFFVVAALLPESVGRKVQEALQQDLLFARQIAMGLTDAKFDLSTSGYRRPNYEEMEGKGLKMYMALDLDKPLSNRRRQPHLFDSKNVVDIDSLTSKTA